MMIGRITLLFLAIISTYLPAFSQRSRLALPGELLVSLRSDTRPEELARRYESVFGYRKVAGPDKVADLLRVWLFHCDTTEHGENEALNWFRQQPEVNLVQHNHRLDYRSEPPPPALLLPNDPLYSSQWQYDNSGANGGLANADLDAPDAWTITTGGLSAANDTIVVAVIDGGVDAFHPDLAPNLWVNWADLPGDQIDNDGNGYVDDTRGWNVYAGNDDIAGNLNTHGTPVSGIVGARGNNNIGVTGVNWQVKILFVAGNGQESAILSAYDYVLKARQRYNATNGQKGAFVVAVNCSWGINYGQPADAPLWCAAFDSLGAAGILSAAATANQPIDVDVLGDLPTACTSDFLIAVTSLDNADQKAANAAWGAQSIDLGAYGQNVFTLSAGGGYGPQSGTSFAAPQVSGAIALLYSAPCPNLIALAKTHPAEAALWAKALILESAVPVPALDGITLSNGRLNLRSLLEHYQAQCSDCPSPFSLQASSISTSSAVLKWLEIDDFQYVNLRWRQAGEPLWNYQNNVTAPFFLSNLQACTEYEFSVYAGCSSGQTSGWAETLSFKTDGCCLPPASVWTEAVSSSMAVLAWENVTAALGYKVRLRAIGGPWQMVETDTISVFPWPALLPCTSYEAQVQTRCDTGNTLYSASCFFTTTGCGVCTDANYCPAAAGLAQEEWIAAVQIGDWVNASGGQYGYQDFTGNLSGTPEFTPLASIPVTITPGFTGTPYKEYFRIFVDFNADGDFDDAGELAFDPGFALDAPISGYLQTPDFWAFGPTRFRVMMKYKGVQNLPPVACETFDYGQVEDYCALLTVGGLKANDSRAPEQIHIFPQPAQDEVALEISDLEDEKFDLKIWGQFGNLVFEARKCLDNGHCKLSTTRWPPGIYVVQLESNGRLFQGKIVKI